MPVETTRDHVDRRVDTLMLCAVYQKTLRFNCQRCLHVSVLPSIPVWWHFQRRNWDHTLYAAVKRFYCSSCWNRRKVRIHDPVMRVTDDKPTAEPLPWPDERTWKRLVSRFRT